jgi:hypothetical protein
MAATARVCKLRRIDADPCSWPEIGLASQRLRIILYAPWYDIPHSFNPGIVHLAAGVVTLSRKK